jgi:hypothetical protein
MLCDDCCRIVRIAATLSHLHRRAVWAKRRPGVRAPGTSLVGKRSCQEGFGRLIANDPISDRVRMLLIWIDCITRDGAPADAASYMGGRVQVRGTAERDVIARGKCRGPETVGRSRRRAADMGRDAGHVVAAKGPLYGVEMRQRGRRARESLSGDLLRANRLLHIYGFRPEDAREIGVLRLPDADRCKAMVHSELGGRPIIGGMGRSRVSRLRSEHPNCGFVVPLRRLPVGWSCIPLACPGFRLHEQEGRIAECFSLTHLVPFLSPQALHEA